MGKQSRRAEMTRSANHQGQLIEEIIDDNLLPEACEIAKLKELDTDIVTWLKDRAEKEQEFRQKTFHTKLKLVHKHERGERHINYLGIIFAFLIIMTGLLLAAYLMYLGKEITGTIFAGTILITMASMFLNKVRLSTKEKKT